MSNDKQVVLAYPFAGLFGPIDPKWQPGEEFCVKIGDETVRLRVVEIRDTTLVAEIIPDDETVS